LTQCKRGVIHKFQAGLKELALWIESLESAASISASVAMLTVARGTAHSGIHADYLRKR